MKLDPLVTSPLRLYLASLDQGPALGMSSATQDTCLPLHLYLRPLDANILAPFVHGICFQVVIMDKLMSFLFLAFITEFCNYTLLRLFDVSLCN